MSQRRITIYDLARAMGISASYVSRALNEHPSINPDVVAAVKKKPKN
jgi:LacI family transcriptional regulator